MTVILKVKYTERVCWNWSNLMLVIEENPCTLDEFACRNRQCVPLLQVCDGILHCSDGSDESSCQIRPGRGWFWFKLTFNMFCPTVLKSLVNWCWFWTGVLALFTFIIFHLTSFFVLWWVFKLQELALVKLFYCIRVRKYYWNIKV